jgi:hypothetical protein
MKRTLQSARCQFWIIKPSYKSEFSGLKWGEKRQFKATSLKLTLLRDVDSR